MAFDFLPQGININAMGGTCYGCGDSHRQNVSAFQAPAFEEFLGQIQICSRCVDKMADTLGYMPKSKHEAVRATNLRHTAETQSLHQEIADLRAARENDHELHSKEIADLKLQIEKAKAGAQ